MAENQFFIDSDKLSEAALERKHKLETDPLSRTNHMEYMPGMEQIDPTIRNKVLSEMDSYDYNKYTARDVQNALEHETCRAAASGISQLFGAHGTACKDRDRQAFRKYGVSVHTALHCKLLRELLCVLRI